ncbi:MAG: hypothetical protein AABZ33_13930 [Chloroflexota bacterium]
MATLMGQMEDNLAGAVSLAAAGDEAALARIIQAHHDDMTRVCFVICGDLDIADKAVQADTRTCRPDMVGSSLATRALPLVAS